jgi:flagellar biosynthetic protein FliO
MLTAARSQLADFGPLVVKSALVLALIAAGAWAASRFLAPRVAARRKGARMRVVERLPLEPRRGLYLVEVDGRELVVGVTERGVAFHELEAPRAPGGGTGEVEP